MAREYRHLSKRYFARGARQYGGTEVPGTIGVLSARACFQHREQGRYDISINGLHADACMLCEYLRIGTSNYVAWLCASLVIIQSIVVLLCRSVIVFGRGLALVCMHVRASQKHTFRISVCEICYVHDITMLDNHLTPKA